MTRAPARAMVCIKTLFPTVLLPPSNDSQPCPFLAVFRAWSGTQSAVISTAPASAGCCGFAWPTAPRLGATSTFAVGLLDDATASCQEAFDVHLQICHSLRWRHLHRQAPLVQTLAGRETTDRLQNAQICPLSGLRLSPGTHQGLRR